MNLNTESIESGSNESVSNHSRRSKSRCRCICCASFLVFLLTTVLFIFVLFPFAFRFCTTLQRQLVFLHQIKKEVPKPTDVDLSPCAQQLHVPINGSGNQLGAWYIPPGNKCNQSTQNMSLSQWLAFDDQILVLFVHGIRGSRATPTRVERYRVWSQVLHLHTFAFDYRGFGDSCNCQPTVQGLVNDTATIYHWLLAKGVHQKRILLWGHSLGTAISIRFLASLPSKEVSPLGTVLEAPLTSTSEAIKTSRIRRYFRFFPFFNFFFERPVVTNDDFNVNSVLLLEHVKCPLLILHAEDDPVLSFVMGQKMFQTALELQPADVKPANFVAFEAKKKYGHNRVITDPEIPQIISNFINQIKHN